MKDEFFENQVKSIFEIATEFHLLTKEELSKIGQICLDACWRDEKTRDRLGIKNEGRKQ